MSSFKYRNTPLILAVSAGLHCVVTKLLELHAHTDVIDRVSEVYDCCTIILSATSFDASSSVVAEGSHNMFRFIPRSLTLRYVQMDLSAVLLSHCIV